MRPRLAAIVSVFGRAFRNPALRRVGLAYALFVAAEFGVWITLLVYAYSHGGASAGTLIVLVQLIPCMVLSPFIGALVDRRRPSRVLRAGYGLQALSIGAVAVAIGAGAPAFVVFVLAPLTTLALTCTRSPQAAILPALVHTPDELTAANVMTGWTDGAASLVGPALAGVLLAVSGAATAVAATAALSAVAMVLVFRIEGPPAAVVLAADKAKSDVEPPKTKRKPSRLADVRRSIASLGAGAGSNVVRTLHNPQIRVMLALHTFYFVLVGALDLLCVVLAVNLLHLGPGGAGFLNAAFGAGALFAAIVTMFLVGRRHLANTLTGSLAVAVLALALIGAIPRVVPALLLIAGVGLAGAVFDTTGRTLLQRSAPADAIAGTFSILESLMDLGLALGAILVRVALAIGGIRAALWAPAVCAFLLLVVLWRRIRNIDASATVPQVEIQLLRSISIFAALPAPSLEGIARQLVPVPTPSGTVVIREGDPGDLYYAVADGQLEVSRDGSLQATLARGAGFGEIALIRDVPRQATVIAASDALLYSLEKQVFVETITGSAIAARVTGRVIDAHLGRPGWSGSAGESHPDTEGRSADPK